MATVASVEAKRRRHIIDSTIRVLVRDGVAGTSLSRVATEAKVAKGIICYYFKSKDQLYDAVLVSVRERMVAAAIAEADGMDDAWERISAFIAAHLTEVRGRRSEILALRHLASTSAGGSMASDHLAVWREQQAWLAATLAEGQHAGTFKPFDEQVVANAISGAIESALLQWAHDPAVDLDHRTEQLLALFEPGVRNAPHARLRQGSHFHRDDATVRPDMKHGAP